MSKSKILVAIIGLFFVSQAAGLSSSIKSSCDSGEEPLASIEDSSGGSIAVPGQYSQDVCVSGSNGFDLRENCEKFEANILTLRDINGGNFSIYTGKTGKEMCSTGTEAMVRNNCLPGEVEALTVQRENNSFVAGPGTYGKKLCLFDSTVENFTASISPLPGTFYIEDGFTLTTSSTFTDNDLDYPYIVAQNSLMRGIVSYGEFLRLSHPDSDTLSMTLEDGSFLLPLTEATYSEVEKRRGEILQREFLNIFQPSFGFSRPDTPMVNVRLDIQRNATGFGNTFQAGEIKILVRNTGDKLLFRAS